MDWKYLILDNGRLIDRDGFEANESWPDFVSLDDAEQWLAENDIRASVSEEHITGKELGK